MASQSRRLFLKTVSGTLAGLGLSALPLALRARADEWAERDRPLDRDDPTYVIKEEYQDIEAEWFGVNHIILRAEDVFIAAEVTGLWADEGSHKHALKVSAADMAKLKAGQMVVVKTDVAAGHTHNIKIDPANKVKGGTILLVKDPGP